MSCDARLIQTQPISHAIGGALGSAAALLAFYPLERARIELQSQAVRTQDSNEEVEATKYSVNVLVPTYAATIQTTSIKTSLRDCLYQLWKRDELYRGMSPIVCTLTISNFVFFYVHTFMKQVITASALRPTKRSLLMASCLAGILNVFLTNPLWVANLRIVNSTPTKNEASLWAQVREIAQNEGTCALWQGTWTSMLLVSNPVIQFYTYEQLKSWLLAKRQRRRIQDEMTLSPLEAFVAGATSKILATLCTYPLQLAQSILRLQRRSVNGTPACTDGPTHCHLYKNTWDCLWRLYISGGLSKWFVGMKAKLLQTTLTTAFTFLTYEQILHAVHQAHVCLGKQ
ncbi:hypothetical protein MPSEU_000276200 [Mayamaea pseudoterrestris]|nr:hypothetical protein MPSEU_000276200 [Mayamaea pseudoterrestris]